MKIEKKYQLQKAVSTDDIRPTMSCVLLKNNKAIATNGHILVEVPVEGYDSGWETLIDMKEWKFIQNNCKELKFEIENGSIKGEEYILLYRNQITEKYPNYESAKPKADNSVEYEIAFNPTLLNDLIKAMGLKKDESIRLKFYGKNKPIVIKPNRYNNNVEYGLLMPVRISD